MEVYSLCKEYRARNEKVKIAETLLDLWGNIDTGLLLDMSDGMVQIKEFLALCANECALMKGAEGQLDLGKKLLEVSEGLLSGVHTERACGLLGTTFSNSAYLCARTGDIDEAVVFVQLASELDATGIGRLLSTMSKSAVLVESGGYHEAYYLAREAVVQLNSVISEFIEKHSENELKGHKGFLKYVQLCLVGHVNTVIALEYLGRENEADTVRGEAYQTLQKYIGKH